MYKFVLLFICFAFGAALASSKPGIITTISESFIENEANGLFEDLETDLVGEKLGSFQRKHNKIKWGLNDISLYQFTAPKTDIGFGASGGDGLQITARLKGGVMKSRFGWWASYDTWIHNFRMGGAADAEFHDVDITKVLDIDIMNEKLHMEPCMTCCNIQIRDIKIYISGSSLSWLLNKVISWFEWYIKDIIKEEACNTLNNLVQNDVNDILGSMDTEKVLTKDIKIDYTPVFLHQKEDCLQLGLAGIVSGTSERFAIQLHANNDSDISAASRCSNDDTNFRFIISKRSIQTLFETLYKSGKLSYSVNPDQITKAGPLFQPGFFAKHRNELLQHSIIKINMNTTEIPSVDIRSTGIQTTFPIELNITLHHPNTSKRHKLVLTTTADVLIGLKITLNDTQGDMKIAGKTSDLSVRVKSVSSSKDEYTSEKVEKFLDFVMKTLVRPIANKHLSDGASISMSKYFTLHSSTLRFQQDYMEVDGMIAEW